MNHGSTRRWLACLVSPAEAAPQQSRDQPMALDVPASRCWRRWQPAAACTARWLGAARAYWIVFCVAAPLLIGALGPGTAQAVDQPARGASKPARSGPRAAALEADAGKASDAADAASPAANPADPVAATVNGVTIRVGEVDAALGAALGGRPVPDSTKALLRAETLAQLIDRQLVFASLLTEGPPVTDNEVAAARAQLQTQLAARKLTIEKLLADQHQTEAALRQQLVWQVLWERYVKRHLTADMLERFFQSHRAEFDGTKLHVAHIVLRPDHPAEADNAEKLLRRAQQIRTEIVDQKLTFAEAAKKYSAGPSRHSGGDAGWIERHAPMVDAFSRAAFALDVGQISPSVQTPFGVHLITVLETAPGKKAFGEVRDAVVQPATLQLFSELAERLRQDAKIEFTAGVPHFKPGTRELTAESE